MSRIAISTVIDAPPDQVWATVEDIASHVQWMQDAEAIRITSAERRGVGVAFECDTKVGPFELTDHLEVTEWEPGRSMGVRHVGLVNGEGRFTLEAVGADRTRFAWEEDLTFPTWMGGRVGATAASPVLRWVWAGNLRRLKRLVEVDQPSPAAW